MTLLLIIIASVLITYLILEFLKHQSYVSQLIIGQFYVPFISIIIVFQIFIFEIEKYKFTLSIFYFTLNVFILSLYISTYTFYKSENGKIKLLNCILCYFNIILVCVMLFTYMGYGFMIYEINNQTSNLHNLQFNIKGKQNVINTFACFVSYGIDNVNKDIGVTLTPGKSKDIKTNEILFRLTCKIYVSTYIALVLSF